MSANDELNVLPPLPDRPLGAIAVGGQWSMIGDRWSVIDDRWSSWALSCGESKMWSIVELDGNHRPGRSRCKERENDSDNGKAGQAQRMTPFYLCSGSRHPRTHPLTDGQTKRLVGELAGFRVRLSSAVHLRAYLQRPPATCHSLPPYGRVSLSRPGDVGSTTTIVTLSNTTNATSQPTSIAVPRLNYGRVEGSEGPPRTPTAAGRTPCTWAVNSPLYKVDCEWRIKSMTRFAPTVVEEIVTATDAGLYLVVHNESPARHRPQSRVFWTRSLSTTV